VAELKTEFGSELSVDLIPGSGGVYLICVDGRQIFSKKDQKRFPEEGEIVDLIKKGVA
jgi:selT/selW/selH-like putative selenoprotein